ncbi:MAG: ribonuclease HII [Patescibacteria group bacterium]
MEQRQSRAKLSNRLRIPQNDHEEYLRGQGFNIICGLDEVGRGAWAGPLVAAAVILPASRQGESKRLYGLRDSKLLSHEQRVKLAKKIKRTSKFGIGEVTVEEIDKLKLTKATQLAFSRALKKLKAKVDFVLVDGFKIDSPLPCRVLKKGDMICSSIAAASIVAKVYRDNLMRKLDKKYRGYYFSLHKGYGTRLHRERIAKLGCSGIHRKYYLPIKNTLSNR